MPLHQALSLSVAALALSAAATAQQAFYLVDITGNLYRVDGYATNSSAVSLGRLDPFGSGAATTDLSVDPLTGDFFTVTFSTFGGSDWLRFDRQTLAPTLADVDLFVFYNGLDSAADGRLYSSSSSQPRLRAIEPVSGRDIAISERFLAPSAGDVATDVDGTILVTDLQGNLSRYIPSIGETVHLGQHGLGPVGHGIEVDVDGTVYMVSDVGDIYRLDVPTMTPTLIGSTGILATGCEFELPPTQTPGLAYGFCPQASPNASGMHGALAFSGSIVAADNDATLAVSDLPAGQFGVIVYGNLANVGTFPANSASNGGSCISSSQFFLRGPGQIFRTDPSGSASVSVDLPSLAIPVPAPMFSFTTVAFQAWHRDPAGAGNHFTNGLQVWFE